MTVWKSNPRRLTPWTRQYFSGSPNSLVDVYAGIDEIVDAVKNNAARTRRLTTARPSTCEDSVICGTAVFVCLVCGGAGSSNDRFTLRSPPQKVIKFLVNCGEPNLQNLLVPSRLEATLAVLDTDRDGHIDAMEWC